MTCAPAQVILIWSLCNADFGPIFDGVESARQDLLDQERRWLVAGTRVERELVFTPVAAATEAPARLRGWPAYLSLASSRCRSAADSARSARPAVAGMRILATATPALRSSAHGGVPQVPVRPVADRRSGP